MADKIKNPSNDLLFGDYAVASSKRQNAAVPKTPTENLDAD